MFTGIIEELGTVEAIEQMADSVRLTVHGPLVTSDASDGSSIAVNGVCLTVVELLGSPLPTSFTADVMYETLTHSSLGALVPGGRVNLERPVRLADRLGGHLVQGHVDAEATVVSRTPGERWEVVRISLPQHLDQFVVSKGSITVDGVSLTVSDVSDPGEDEPWFEVSLIPVTLAATTLGARAVGSRVNLEVDIVAKYVQRMLIGEISESGV